MDGTEHETGGCLLSVSGASAADRLWFVAADRMAALLAPYVGMRYEWRLERADFRTCRVVSPLSLADLASHHAYPTRTTEAPADPDRRRALRSAGTAAARRRRLARRPAPRRRPGGDPRLPAESRARPTGAEEARLAIAPSEPLTGAPREPARLATVHRQIHLERLWRRINVSRGVELDVKATERPYRTRHRPHFDRILVKVHSHVADSTLRAVAPPAADRPTRGTPRPSAAPSRSGSWGPSVR